VFPVRYGMNIYIKAQFLDKYHWLVTVMLLLDVIVLQPSPSIRTIKKCIIYFYNFRFKEIRALIILTTIEPESMTRTLSESIIVFRRWAIVRTVQFWNFLRIVSCTKVSVLQRQNV
jgi:hypothetical protein